MTGPLPPSRENPDSERSKREAPPPPPPKVLQGRERIQYGARRAVHVIGAGLNTIGQGMAEPRGRKQRGYTPKIPRGNRQVPATGLSYRGFGDTGGMSGGLGGMSGGGMDGPRMKKPNFTNDIFGEQKKPTPPRRRRRRR
jgi:hypothetical protein